MFVYDQDIDAIFTLTYYTDNLKRQQIQNSNTEQTKIIRLRYSKTYQDENVISM